MTIRGDIMPVTFQQLIDTFVDGAIEGISETKRSPGNLRINGDRLYHYSTPIAERYGDKIILNTLQTGQVQKKLKDTIPSEKRIDVKRVLAETTQSLSSFLQSE